jgi:2-polyprenyl-6-methoxyphenol hydroxylase-like FAD-dependent oxidoreductase
MKTTSWDLMYYLLCANFDRTPSKYCEVPAPVSGEGSVPYDYGHTVKNILDKQGSKVEVQYENKDGVSSSSTADLVIAADGPSSTIRKIFLPNVEREYTGYVAWRGTIPENEASEAAKETFTENTTYYHTRGIQILAYTIPGPHGTLEVGKRLINWVWYCNYAQGSSEFKELMTDCDGRSHQITLPAGKINPSVWEQQKRYARGTLSPQFAEIVEKTQQPFIQAITDVTSSEISFLGGKVRLIGDAVAGFRPHTASSTSQAAFDAEKLSELLRGEIDEGRWEEEVMNYARTAQRSGIESGNRSQFGNHPLAR